MAVVPHAEVLEVLIMDTYSAGLVVVLVLELVDAIHVKAMGIEFSQCIHLLLEQLLVLMNMEEVIWLPLEVILRLSHPANPQSVICVMGQVR